MLLQGLSLPARRISLEQMVILLGGNVQNQVSLQHDVAVLLFHIFRVTFTAVHVKEISRFLNSINLSHRSERKQYNYYVLHLIHNSNQLQVDKICPKLYFCRAQTDFVFLSLFSKQHGVTAIYLVFTLYQLSEEIQR